MSANHGGRVGGMSPELGSDEKKHFKNHTKRRKFMICLPNHAFSQDLDPVGVGRTRVVSPNIYLNPLRVGCLRSNLSCIWHENRPIGTRINDMATKSHTNRECSQVNLFG